ncbi:hypothetical protein ACJMK2_011613 [Sinanodonta woodiana]|uniref:CARD domain-containing protein n=1 Tax=Sinanodonta woodiana TaxID=1069815 RepID=A0ABD3V5L2_SINWO
MKLSLFGKIQSQWDLIVHNLDVKRVCDVLMTKFTLLPYELQRINSEVTHNDRARQLLEILKVKDDQQFENFLSALDITGHKYIADNIRKAKVPREYVETAYSEARASTSSSSNSTRRPDNGTINTISSLRPFQKGWRICVRVTNKNKVSKYKKYGGWNQRFNVSFADDSGSIDAVAFGEAVNKFYELLEEQRVYYISGATIKKAKSKFSQGNAYDMVLENDTNIELCYDEDNLDLPTEISYNFVEIDKLEPGKLCDVVGVVKDFQAKTIGKWNIIEVHIVDRSKKMVPLTLNMKDVENLDLTGNPVIAVKGAWLKNSQGHIYLKKMPSTKIKTNPDSRETDLLLRWFTREGRWIEFEKI